MPEPLEERLFVSSRLSCQTLERMPNPARESEVDRVQPAAGPANVGLRCRMASIAAAAEGRYSSASIAIRNAAVPINVTPAEKCASRCENQWSSNSTTEFTLGAALRGR